MALNTELGPRAFCLNDNVSVTQEESQGGAVGREGDGKEQESSGGARPDKHREAGPGSRGQGSAWAATRTHPAGPALPVPWGCREACKLQETGHGSPKLVGISDGPEGPGQCAGRVLGGLPAVPGGLRVRWGCGDAQAALCPPQPRRRTALPVPTFRAAAARSPRGTCAGIWVPGTRAQPELTLTLPTSCIRSSTRCGPRSLWRASAAAGGGRVGQRRPRPHTHTAHRCTKTLLMQPLRLRRVSGSGKPPRRSVSGCGWGRGRGP